MRDVEAGKVKKIFAYRLDRFSRSIADFSRLRELLAEKIERTPAFIGHVEAPKVNKAVSLDTLFDIATILDVPAYKFLLFDEN